MKRFLAIAASAMIAILAAAPVSAQVKNTAQKTDYARKTGYINTETILAAVPGYKVAAEKLEALNNQYNNTLSAELKKVETLYNDYQKQKNSLSASQRQARENEIISREQEVKRLRQSYFGEGGLFEKKNEELLGPIREKVQRAIDKVAESGKYMIIFDISALQGVVYADSASDLSEQVIKALD